MIVLHLLVTSTAFKRLCVPRNKAGLLNIRLTDLMRMINGVNLRDGTFNKLFTHTFYLIRTLYKTS